jgi:predicted amidophosphoribosyltransferase
MVLTGAALGVRMSDDTKCPKCRGDIDPAARVCPHCRYRLRFDLEHSMKVAGWVMVAVLIAMVGGYYLMGG